jgi:hypothetical protein
MVGHVTVIVPTSYIASRIVTGAMAFRCQTRRGHWARVQRSSVTYIGFTEKLEFISQSENSDLSISEFHTTLFKIVDLRRCYRLAPWQDTEE